MKKFICIVLVLCGLTCTVSAEITGSVYATDIHAFIDHLMVPSYNIDGYTAVIVRDLENFGYTVIWDENTKTVNFYRDFAKLLTPWVPVFDGTPVGTKLYDVYSTDIRTFFNGKEIPSYNIGGRTAVRFRDIGIVGDVVFDEENRTANAFCRDAEYFQDELDYIKNVFYGTMLLLSEADNALKPMLSMLQSGKYDWRIAAEYKAFHEDMLKRLETYKAFKEPYGFAESSQELWWAMINTRYAGETAMIMADNLYSGKDNAESMIYFNQYQQDSMTQRRLALDMLDAEMQALTLFWG